MNAKSAACESTGSNLRPARLPKRWLILIRAAVAIYSCNLVAPTVQAATAETVAGSGIKGFSGDGAPAAQANLAFPTGVAKGPDGALYICDTENHRIRKVSADGKITTIAGTGEPGWSGDGGKATAARLHEPYEIRFDREGNIFWVERLSHTVRKVDPHTGIISTVAGNGTAGFSGDGG